MAEPSKEIDSSVQIRSRGEAAQSTDSNEVQQGEAHQNQAQQQQEASPWKSMIVRMVIFWLVINFFRSKGPAPPTNTGDGKEMDNGPCSNLFSNGQLMVSYFK